VVFDLTAPGAPQIPKEIGPGDQSPTPPTEQRAFERGCSIPIQPAISPRVASLVPDPIPPTMTRLFQTSVFFVAVLLFLPPAKMRAQQPAMPGPVPELASSPPPEPETLPPPPPMEWQPLGPKGSDDVGSGDVTVIATKPEPEASIAPPPLPLVETPIPGVDFTKLELAKPEVEIWREDSEWPQKPQRHSNRLETAYIAGTAAVWLKVQFAPEAAGKLVSARPGPGITLQPPEGIFTVSSSGECIVLAQLQESVVLSHINFLCEGIKTVLPVSRATLATVEAKEAENQP
jgi:hypothetical protein